MIQYITKDLKKHISDVVLIKKSAYGRESRV